jgi:hypothetical protein
MRLTRLISSAARKSLSKSMSSLAPGHILSGKRWNYRIINAVEGDTQISTCFKAEIIKHENSFGSPKWFVKIDIIILLNYRADSAAKGFHQSSFAQR